MAQGVEEIQRPDQVASDLEQYRRLVELQKQMIELARQNKLAAQKCDVLRERVSAEIIVRNQKRIEPHQLLREKLIGLLKRFPKFTAAESDLNQPKIKDVLPASLCE
ncbi:MAG TPA: hypothetical protein VHG71_10820 [Verrucomicrobiae bacterium]|nr:hypothetical protein [Verrucomicrobiae bacterium]